MPKPTQKRSPKRYDATLKELVETYPADWIAQFGLSVSDPIDVIDADLSTVTTVSDKILCIQAPSPWLLHIELQAGHDANLALRVLKYNILLHDRHRLPVHSVIVLLRPEADNPALTGRLTVPSPIGGEPLIFHYQVIRVWQLPVEDILAGGLGTLPLAPIAMVNFSELPGIIRQIETRFEQETHTEVAKKLVASAYILTGLRHTASVAIQLFHGVSRMKESTTYRAILEEGRTEEAQKMLLLLGKRRFGSPDPQIKRAIESITDIRRLENMTTRILDAADWGDLLTYS